MKFLKDNVWVWGGTALVLITLSGKTRSYGLTIAAAAVVIHLLATLTDKDSDS